MSAPTLTPHPTGPWLLRARGRLYLIPPELGRRIEGGRSGRRRGTATAGLTAREAAALDDLLGPGSPGARRPRSRAVWPRLVLVPGRLAAPLGRACARLAEGRVLLWLFAVGAAGCAAGLAAGRGGSAAIPSTSAPSPWVPVLALSLFLALALWHEIGHAAALARHGYPPGPIGCGLLLVLPVLYCDVTAVAALPRRDRLEVDLAGVAFQLAPAGLLLAAGRLAHLPALAWAGTAGLAAVLWSLLPFLRTDGYWLLCDLLGRRDLEAPVDAAPGRAAVPPRLAAAVLLVYRVAHLVFLAAVAGGIVWRLVGAASRARAGGGRTGVWLAILVAGVLAGFLVRRLGRIVPVHLAGLRRDAGTLVARPAVTVLSRSGRDRGR